MKKFIAIILTLACALALAIPAFAAGELNGTTTSGTHDVNVDVTTPAETVYELDVSWGTLDFTYAFESDAVWNADEHAYETGAGNDKIGTWSNGGVSTITVTNRSNEPVAISASFDASTEKLTTGAVNGVTATLTGGGPIATAEGTAKGSAPTGSITCTVTGVPLNEDFTLATITLKFE